jgi:flagellar hook-associated protein 3 FlgL
MRVNPNMQADMLSYLQVSQNQEQTAIEQLATGLRVNLPSDDPAAAAANLVNNASISAGDQYVQNIDSVQQTMTSADSTLSSVVTELTQAISLGVEGSNGTLSASDSQAIAQQVSGIQSQIFALANTSFQGVYLFGGTATSAAPFVKDPTSPTGVQYNGNEQANQIQIGEGQQVATSVSGDQLFGSGATGVFGSLQTLITALQSGSTSDVGTATVQLRTAFDQVNTSRVFYGNALSGLTEQENYLGQEKVNLQTNENNLVGADPTTAASVMSQASVAQQATLEAIAKAQSLSLLNYLPQD